MTTITIPIDVAEAAAEALGNFVSDHGWSDSDMQAMDNLDAYIARHKAIRAELAKPVEPVEPVAWRLTDHLCKACGGRILQCATNRGITGGGNPTFRCADCGASASGMGPEVLCWCGFSYRGQHHMTAYLCKPFSILKEHPELERHFRACGCDPGRGEVGVVLERDYIEATKEGGAA